MRRRRDEKRPQGRFGEGDIDDEICRPQAARPAEASNVTPSNTKKPPMPIKKNSNVAGVAMGGPSSSFTRANSRPKTEAMHRFLGFEEEASLPDTQPSRGDVSEHRRTVLTEDGEQSQTELSMFSSDQSRESSRMDRLVENGDWEAILFAASANHHDQDSVVGDHLYM